jgi:hypothetical protein
LYRYFNFLIASDLPLPELTEAAGEKASYSFSLQVPGDLIGRDWLHHWRYADGNTFLSVAREGDSFVLRFPETADFRVVPDTGEIICCPVPGITDNTVRHLLLDQVLPRVVGHDGRIVLHASAITDAGQAILFMGNPWSGKSTLAANYVTDGGILLADDCVLLEHDGNGIVAIANYSGARLWQDSFDALKDRTMIAREEPLYPQKKRLIYRDGQKKQQGNLPVKAIFLLGPPGPMPGNSDITIRRLPGARVILELLKYTFVLDVKDKEKMKEKFHAHGKIALSIPLYRLDYPRDYSILGKVFDAVRDVLSGNRAATCGVQ